MFSDVVPEELVSVLDERVGKVLAQAGIIRPPVDALQVAAAVGMVVALDERQAGRARRVRLRGTSSILIRSEPRPERRQWSVAHEVGEQLVHEVFARLGIDGRAAVAGAREKIANALANRLLLPSPWFLADAKGCDWDLFALKSRYRTASHELVARRMLDFPPPVIISLFDQGRLTWRKSNQPGRVPVPSPAERTCWLKVHERQSISQIRQGPVSIHAWAIHEPGWKREILRTVVAEEAANE